MDVDAEARPPSLHLLSFVTLAHYTLRKVDALIQEASFEGNVPISAYRPNFKFFVPKRTPTPTTVLEVDKKTNESYELFPSMTIAPVSAFIDKAQSSGFTQDYNTITTVHFNESLLQHVVDYIIPRGSISKPHRIMWTRWDTGELCLVTTRPLYSLQQSQRPQSNARLLHLEVQPLLPCLPFRQSLDPHARPMVLDNLPILNPDCLPVDTALLHDPSVLFHYYFDLQTHGIPTPAVMRQIPPNHLHQLERHLNALADAQLDDVTQMYANETFHRTHVWNDIVSTKSLLQLTQSLPYMPLNGLAVAWTLAPDISSFPTTTWSANNQWIWIDDRIMPSASTNEIKFDPQQDDVHEQALETLRSTFTLSALRRQYRNQHVSSRQLSPVTLEFVHDALQYVRTRLQVSEESAYGFSLPDLLHVHMLALVGPRADLEYDSKRVPVLAIVPLFHQKQTSAINFYFDDQLLNSEVVGHLDAQLQPVTLDGAIAFQIRLVYELNYNQAWQMECRVSDVTPGEMVQLVDEAAFFKRASALQPLWDTDSVSDATCINRVRRNQALNTKSWQYKT